MNMTTGLNFLISYWNHAWFSNELYRMYLCHPTCARMYGTQTFQEPTNIHIEDSSPKKGWTLNNITFRNYHLYTVIGICMNKKHLKSSEHLPFDDTPSTNLFSPPPKRNLQQTINKTTLFLAEMSVLSPNQNSAVEKNFTQATGSPNSLCELFHLIQ